jgi:hypothetical protein
MKTPESTALYPANRVNRSFTGPAACTTKYFPL